MTHMSAQSNGGKSALNTSEVILSISARDFFTSSSAMMRVVECNLMMIRNVFYDKRRRYSLVMRASGSWRMYAAGCIGGFGSCSLEN